MSAGTAERRTGPLPAAVLAALIVLALALRFYRLGDWGFEGDEIFTLRDSLSLRPNNPRPLIYLLNHFVVRPFVPLDEFGLRLLPALAGVLAVPAFYAMARRLVGTRAALFGALFLTLSTVHVYQSQNARYWSLVFLFSAIYPYALFIGIRERNGRALALGLVTLVLGALSHPVAVLLVGGLALWLALTYLRRISLAELWSQKGLRWGALAIIALGTAIAVRYTPILRGWVGAHDEGRVGDHLLHLPTRPGLKQILYVVSYVEGLTIPLVLAGVLGIYLLWQSRDRALGVLLVCLAIVPVVFLALLSLRTPVSTSYLLPAAPPLFIGAGVLLDRLAGVDYGTRPRWLVAVGVAAMMLYSGLPTLFSQYRDGRRHDFQAAADWLGQRVATGDLVYSDQVEVLRHYLPAASAEPLQGDTAALGASVRTLAGARNGQALWIVAPYTAAAGGHRTGRKVGVLKTWIYDNCRLRTTIGVARLDFRNNELQIYRCAVAATREAGASSR
ncbi:MAG: glycosyltransferase family 39 protein [Gemmatimonadales bacterium]|nr:glycosyltransferase family 39 protein [Gemmatimonadales bacterium]